MRHAFLFVSAVVLAVVLAACDRLPTGPSRDDAPPEIPPGATLHQVPLPGTSQTFRWWISSITPERGSQLVIGQHWSIQAACDAPNGYSFFLQGEFSDGPGTPGGINTDGYGYPVNLGAGSGSTDGCSWARSVFGVGSEVKPSTPNLPYVRFSVWVRAGTTFSPPGYPITPPDMVIDEFIGWRRP